MTVRTTGFRRRLAGPLGTGVGSGLPFRIERSVDDSRPLANAIGDGGETETETASEDRAPAGDVPTVLLVDDEEALVDVYGLWLEESCTVRTAYSGAEALDLIDGVDVVFLDRQMPGLSGTDVLERLRDRGIDCRVAFLSAYKPDEGVADLSHDAYLKKPVTREELLGAVETLAGDE